jgi:hypothetical protein
MRLQVNLPQSALQSSDLLHQSCQRILGNRLVGEGRIQMTLTIHELAADRGRRLLHGVEDLLRTRALVGWQFLKASQARGQEPVQIPVKLGRLGVAHAFPWIAATVSDRLLDLAKILLAA